MKSDELRVRARDPISKGRKCSEARNKCLCLCLDLVLQAGPSLSWLEWGRLAAYGHPDGPTRTSEARALPQAHCR